jgi:hypothetical protein
MARREQVDVEDDRLLEHAATSINAGADADETRGG